MSSLPVPDDRRDGPYPDEAPELPLACEYEPTAADLAALAALDAARFDAAMAAAAVRFRTTRYAGLISPACADSIAAARTGGHDAEGGAAW